MGIKTIQDEVKNTFSAGSYPPLPDHALFLVGSNPLPIYAAALALKPKGILLLGTPGVSDVVNCLETSLESALQLSGDKINSASCDPADSCGIQSKAMTLLKKVPPSATGAWLFYTTGTKAMAVQSHDAWKGHVRKPRAHWAVYLSPDGPSLWFDTIPRSFSLYPNDSYAVPELSFKEILSIHQIKPTDTECPFRDYFAIVRFFELATRIHQRVVSRDDGISLYYDLLPPTYIEKADIDRDGKQFKITGEISFLDDSNFKDGSFHTTYSLKEWAEAIGFEKLDSAIDPTIDTVYASLQNAPVPGRSADRKKWRIKAMKWLATEWLETWVAMVLSKSGLFHEVHEGMEFLLPGLGTQKPSEVDVCAMRGHTPFVFSCTVDTKSRLGKHKLFEVRLRANQLGGEHARAAVVCLSENPVAIQEELKQGWAGYGTIKVFGLQDIRSKDTFEASLKNWISELEK